MSKKRQSSKKAYRRVRSQLKGLLLRGGSLDAAVRAKYNLKSSYRAPMNRTRQELLSLMWDDAHPPVVINVPKVFCFIQNAEATAEFLKNLDEILVDDSCYNIFISHEHTQQIGLSASSLFDSKIKDAQKKLKERGVKMRIRGRASNHRQVNNFLAAFGLLKEIEINTSQIGNIDRHYETKFNSFKRVHSKKEPVLKSNAATELTSYFDNCLGHVGYRLTPDGEGNLVSAIGEMLGNAEEHSGIDKNWKVLGCFEVETNHVMFAIVNYGMSIYETLSGSTSTSREVLERIEKVVLNHRSLIVKATDSILSIEDELVEPIWNVMALQEGISSKREEASQEADTRGKGLMDVLQFISEMHQKHEDACLVIISGHSRINVDFDYPIVVKNIGPKMEPWRAISFNKEGDLHLPQDRSKVSYIKHKFPGTIITGRFKLSDNYVKQVENLEEKA